jgi:ELWxxDGT repeat protein
MTQQIVVFEGEDSNNQANLWVSDGTASGTYELTGINDAGSSGLQPTDLTALGNEVLFSGTDADGTIGLWITNGAAAQTYEITGITGAREGNIGDNLTPQDLTVFNNEALFEGIDSSGVPGLWVTDGTASGTRELIGIVGAYSQGIFFPSVDHLLDHYAGVNTSPSFTVFGNEVLFQGTDANDELGLWVTNGTAAGTYELTTAAYAPTDFTVFGSEVLFVGQSTLGNTNTLWVTNGTAAGTQKLTGIGNVNTGFFGFNPTDLTAFNGGVLFSAYDAAGNTGLWESNGTAAGTFELSPIAGAATLFDPRDLTVYNNEVFFAATDSSGHVALWVTDGTAANTHEITGISGASANLDPTNLYVFNGELLFSGYDSQGLAGMIPRASMAFGKVMVPQQLPPNSLA